MENSLRWNLENEGQKFGTNSGRSWRNCMAIGDMSSRILNFKEHKNITLGSLKLEFASAFHALIIFVSNKKLILFEDKLMMKINSCYRI